MKETKIEIDKVDFQSLLCDFMRSQKLLPIILLAGVLLVLVAPTAFGFIVGYRTPTLSGLTSNVTNTTINYIEVNISVSQQINSSILEWTNQSGQSVNVSSTNTINSTAAGVGANQTNFNITNVLNGTHRFKPYILENNTVTNTPTVGTVLNVTVATGSIDVSSSTIQNTMANNTNTTDTTPEIFFNITNNVFTADLAYIVYVNNTNYTGPGAANVTNSSLTGVNLSTLTDGLYTIRVEVRDAVNRRVNSTPLTIRIDTTAPSPTVTLTDTNILNGNSVTSTCTASDANGVNSTSLSIKYPDLTTKTLTSGTAISGENTQQIGESTVTCSATDNVGNTASATKVVTISLGGPKTAANPSATIDATKESTKSASFVGAIQPDNTKEDDLVFSFDSSKTIKQVKLDLSDSVTDPKVTVSEYKSKPTAITAADPSGASVILKYYQIETTVPKTSIKAVKIDLEVLNVSASDKDLVTAYRLVDGTWVPLKTTFKEEKASGVFVYEAEAPGFSYFAVGKKLSAVTSPTTAASPGTSPGATTTPAAASPKATTSPAPKPGAPADLWLYTGIIVAIIVIVVAVVLTMRRKK